MSDEKQKDLYPETNFLPPLEMVLSFFKKKDKPGVVNNVSPDESEEVQGHAVKRIIDHIAHDEQPDQKTND